MKRFFILVSVLAGFALAACDSDDKQDDISVETKEVINITVSSARVSSSVGSRSGAIVRSRGVYWGVSPDSGVDGQKTEDGYGKGDFLSDMTGLQEATTYYVRAYAITEEGTFYGGTLTFATRDSSMQDELPEVETAEVSAVTDISAVCGGLVTRIGEYPVAQCGVCWNTTGEPTLNDPRTMDKPEEDNSFVSEVKDLRPETKYYIRAYATNEAGTSYGEERVFTTLADAYNEGRTEISEDVKMETMAGGGKANFYGPGFYPDTETCCWSLLLRDKGVAEEPDRAVMLEFSTASTDATGIPDGEYAMALQPNIGVAGTAEPGNIYNSVQWGCWYYAVSAQGQLSSGTSAVGGRGMVKVERTSGAQYRVSFTFYDTGGREISGVYSGPIEILPAGGARYGVWVF